MHMPKAAMHKNNGSILGKHDVRFPGIAFVIFAVSKALRKQILPYNFLWL